MTQLETTGRDWLGGGGVKRDADGCYVRWPLCIQAKKGELDGMGVGVQTVGVAMF